MALDAIVRKMVGVADTITKPLQPEVIHEAFASQDNEGKVTYSGPVRRKALVDFKQKMIRTLTGEFTVSRAYVAFIGPVSVGPKDRITLPDGTVGPILDIGGFVDPETGRGYTTEVWLG